LRTLVVSDLHLGTHTRADVLHRADIRDVLLRALGRRGAPDAVDRLVLLGDVLELRAGPVRQALDASRSFFAELGEALDGREILLLAGNHDHAVVAPWLERNDRPLGLEQRFEPAAASYIAAALDGFLGRRTSLAVAHPGVWLRDDVYATHGNYLDRHVTVPSLERLGIGAMSRLVGATTGGESTVDDYEAVTAPIYAWVQAVAQGGPSGGGLLDVGASASVRARRALLGAAAAEEARTGDGAVGSAGRGRAGAVEALRSRAVDALRARTVDALRTRALGLAFPLVIAALNRAGLGPLRTDISGLALRRSSLLAMSEVVGRLGVGARHVIFGHTHRSGPLPGDELAEWTTPGGVSLHNCGCWVFETYLMSSVSGESPYWPGTCVLLDDDGPPRLERLLADRRAETLVGEAAEPG
jgi:hypothetical protein